MENHVVKIISVQNITHDVKQFTIQKPADYDFIPGQATDVSINTPELKNEKRPFTFTSLKDNKNLQFTIKIYEGHDGVTKELDKLSHGDELIIHDVWGAIQYQGEGVFIAGGAGVTPFIAILKNLHAENKLGNNKLIFTNKTEKDIILENEFQEMLGSNFINILTDENNSKYETGHIDVSFLKEHISNFHQKFYICGPPKFMDAIKNALAELGASSDSLVFEK
ncbi:MAG: ferredoxin-NADP reductase [Flavobacterium sp.]|jgi:ferredoxin-NADP reductase